MERFNLLDLRYIMIQRGERFVKEDLHIGHGKRDLLKVAKDHSKSHRAFSKKLFKGHFSQVKSILV